MNCGHDINNTREVLGDVTAVHLHGVRIPVNNDQELFDVMLAVAEGSREAEEAGYGRDYFNQR